MKRLAGILTLAALPSLAPAQEFNYTYVDVGYADTEIDVGPFDIDGDGIFVEGSFEIADNMFVIGGYSSIDYDGGADGDVLNIGVGFNTGLAENLDFVADISYLDAEIATRFGSADESGYAIRAGVRGRMNPNFELEGGLTLVDLDDSETGFRAVARYYFSETFAVFGSLADSDGTSLAIGVRGEFGGNR